ncbi:MAG: minichromosome maintenance protein MCM [Candidatus Micrarchaeota archaeon]
MAEDIAPYVERFREFFETNPKIASSIEMVAMSYPEKKSFEVDCSDLGRFDYNLADFLVAKPDIGIEAARLAASDLGKDKVEAGVKFEPHVRFFNPPREKELLIQDVGSLQIEKMITLEGVITKRAEVRPKVKIAVYKCSKCDAVQKVPMTKKTIVPQVCDACKRRALELAEEESYFVDLQKSEIQELLERLHGGAPASHIELWMEDDLVNTVIPGDTVEVTGILRIRPPVQGKGDSYSKYIDIVHVQKVQREFEEVEIGKEDTQKVIELSKDPRIFEKIVKSIAPSIYGHDEIKAGVALQLFGGTPEKKLPEGGNIRSDIHLLLIGDPGAAKTRILQYVIDLAPKSIYVSGKTVSGVGLTAAAEKDDLSEGGWTLKAGALVLASGGMVAIDEFDKIDDKERAAMHEVMESQTVSVAKAGIVARFKAKTSILAAANPKFGRFDPNKLPGEQFDIPNTLLSRFDLIFPIKDIMDEEKDRRLADHILRSHEAASLKINLLAKDETIIHHDMMRKYIAYARKYVRPKLSKEATEKIKEYYVEMRRMGASQGTVPITPRYIEGMIRLSEASAKARLSETVELADAELAVKLNDFVLRQIALDKETGKIDVDIVATGQPKSKVEKVNIILGLVRDLQREYDMVEIGKLIEQSEGYNIDPVAARRLIEDLIMKGELFKPKPGFIKIVKQYD